MTGLACNFQSSFMTWDVPYRPDPRPHARHNIPLGNRARIQLEALIVVVAEASGAAERFVLIAPCRSEWVYAEERRFQMPSSEYCCIFSLTEQRSVGGSLTYRGQPSRGEPIGGHFRSLRIDVRPFAGTRALETPAAIVAATARNLPLVGRTEIRDPDRGERYMLEYPIKTMNFQPADDSFQVDTGPLLVPDFSAAAERAIDRLELAHVVYNRLDRAEFILRRPTPIADESGREVCQVLYWSEVREYPARTQILAGEDG